MKRPKIAIAQFNPRPGDLLGNSRRIVECIEEAREKGAELVVFPEEAVSGYCIGDHNRNSVLIEESLKILHAVIAPATANIAAIVGLVSPDPNHSMNDGARGARNSFAFVENGKVKSLGHKTLLVDDGVLSDTRFFLPNDPSALEPVLLESTGTRVGVLICQDMWDDFGDVKPARILAAKGADVLVVINSSPYYVGRKADRLEVARRRVAETGLPLFYVNTVGAQDNGKNIILFDGGSFVLEPAGAVTEYPQFEQGVFLPGIDDGVKTTPKGRIEELYDALTFGLRELFSRLDASGVVIGLSGGIDSAINAALVHQVLGGDRLLLLNMPSRFSSATTRDNAARQARLLGAEYKVHPIEDIVRQKKAEFELLNGTSMATLTFENIQARERGNLLMTYSQERGYLVVGNGNKTEFQRGYATLYGDILGAVMPIGDVIKTDVYRLANYINDRFGPLVPEEVITILPSAELSDEQSVDEGKGDPFDYDVKAPIELELLEMERTPAELRALFETRGLDPEIWNPVRGDVLVYDKMSADAFEKLAWEVFRSIERTVFKRIQAPPILKVSRKAFGYDFRESMFVRLRF